MASKKLAAVLDHYEVPDIAHCCKPKEDFKVRCKYCNKPIVGSIKVTRNWWKWGGTTNLWEHLEATHRLIYNHIKSKSVPHESPTPSRSITSYTRSTCCSESHAKEITDMIVRMITSDLRPIRIVEGEGFKNLLHFLSLHMLYLAGSIFQLWSILSMLWRRS